MYDTHMHTTPFSSDSRMKIAEVQQYVRQTGIGVVLTEHMDYEFPEPKVYEFDPEAYFSAYAPHRSDTLLLGVEIGLQRFVEGKNQTLVCSYPFDMVIGSIHAVCGRDLYDPSYFQLFPDRKSAYTAYLEAMYENVRSYDDFDTLAHIDYVSRHAPYENSILLYEEFPNLFDRILECLAAKGKSLEINTRQFGDGRAVAALRKLCCRFAESGGRTVTIGSDAHDCGSIGAYLKEAYQLAAACGLTPVYYKERQACMVL